MTTDRGHGSLVSAIEDLYRRARENALTETDIAQLSDLQHEDTPSLVERIYRSKAAFDDILEEFGKTYDVFRFFTADQIVLDIGAHWGYSAVALRHGGCRAKVISIEAMPLNVPALARLKAVAGGWYDFINVAASDAEGLLRFYIPVINGRANTGLATTGGTLGDYFAHWLADRVASQQPPAGTIDRVAMAITDVPAMPIDLIIEREFNGLGPIVAVKIDIEGHEAFALRGARRLLIEQKPLLMIEGANRNPAVVAELTGHGFFHCDRVDGRLLPKRDYSLQNDGFWIHPDNVSQYQSFGLLPA